MSVSQSSSLAAFTLCARFPTVLREPLRASVTFWEATAPVKLPAWHCSGPGFTVSCRLAAGTRHLHRDCNFTEPLVETAFKSLRHSCRSELTRQGISLP